MSKKYIPPYKITDAIIHLVSEISEQVGAIAVQRQENRIRSIHSSLAIENNSLSLEQVTDIIDGKRVLRRKRAHGANMANSFVERLEANFRVAAGGNIDTRAARGVLQRPCGCGRGGGFHNFHRIYAPRNP